MSFWISFLFALFLYNENIFGISRSIFNVSSLEIFLAYIVYLIILGNNDAYLHHKDFLGIRRMKGLVKGTLQTIFVLIVIGYMMKYSIPRVLSISFAVTLPFVVIIARIIMQNIETRFMGKYLRENILVYGAGTVGKAFVETIKKNQNSELNVVGFIDDRMDKNTYAGNPLPVLGGTNDIIQIVDQYNIERVIVAIKETTKALNDTLIKIAKRKNISIGYHPTQKLFQKTPLYVKDFSGLPLLAAHDENLESKPLYNITKRIFDIIFSCMGLIILLPFFVVVSAIVKIADGGSVFFKQDRVGLDGKKFSIYKFRTMDPKTNKYAHCPTTSEDKRITSVGKILRKLSIDELPQLLNVIIGNMSLVGPRPEMPFIVEQYEDFEKRRLLVKPGITGLWQVSSARTAEIHDNPEYDLHYIENRGLSLDFLIMVYTLLFVFKGLTN